MFFMKQKFVKLFPERLEAYLEHSQTFTKDPFF